MKCKVMYLIIMCSMISHTKPMHNKKGNPSISRKPNENIEIDFSKPLDPNIIPKINLTSIIKQYNDINKNKPKKLTFYLTGQGEKEIHIAERRENEESGESEEGINIAAEKFEMDEETTFTSTTAAAAKENSKDEDSGDDSNASSEEPMMRHRDADAADIELTYDFEDDDLRIQF